MLMLSPFTKDHGRLMLFMMFFFHHLCILLSYFHFAIQVSSITCLLAYVLDSLVRVTRRVSRNHFHSILHATISLHTSGHGVSFSIYEYFYFIFTFFIPLSWPHTVLLRTWVSSPSYRRSYLRNLLFQLITYHAHPMTSHIPLMY